MAEPEAPHEIGPPEGWDNFANNLGSDLAPLLALFGEQVTKQYLSETLSWLDCILFAIAPLGIITAMVAAIRVAGEPWLRSLIGRAKESRGDVEADLMSSTSSDVCELWNGDGVVRVLGSPVLLHLIHVNPGGGQQGQGATSPAVQSATGLTPQGAVSPAAQSTMKPTEDEKPKPATEDKAGIYTFHEAIMLGLYETKDQKNTSIPANKPGEAPGGGIDSTTDTEAYSDIENLRSRQNPPNLSLNVSVKPLEPRILISLAVLGFLLQAGVLVWAAFSQYRLKLLKNDVRPVPYGFPIFAIGTVVLALGMFGCAWAVESSTCEVTWEPTAEHGSKSVLWLQQGGQTVGDQRFESWSRRSVSPDNKITTSHKSAKTIESSDQNTGRPRKASGRAALVNTAVTLAFIGFVLQFFGLRVLHSSVTLAQLGAILIMTLIRCFGHIQRENRNDILDPEQVEGYELDWLAKDLKTCKTWEVITGPTDEGSAASQKSGPNAAMDVMKIRARLARLSKDWELEIRATVDILRNAIEMTMKDVFTNMKLPTKSKNDSTFEWAISVKTEFKEQPTDPAQSKTSEIKLTLRREKDDSNNWRAWKIDVSELEAVLCLWVSSLTNVNRIRAKQDQPRLKQVRLLGLATESAKVDYKLWIHRGTAANQTVLKNKDARYFGRVTEFDRNTNTKAPGNKPNSPPSTEYLCVDAHGSLEILCAQELYTSFLFQLLSQVADVGGITTRRTEDSTTSGSDTLSNDSWSQFRLSNSNLASIAGVYDECRLGTVEEAYLCIVPAFRSANKLPSPHEAYYEARKASAGLAKDRQWGKAIEIDAWLYNNSKETHTCRAKVMAITAEVSSRLRRVSEKLVTDFESITSDPDDEALRLWNLAYSLCRMIAEASEDLATTLLNLYKICPKIKVKLAGADQDAVFRLTFRVAKGLDVNSKSTTEIIKNLYRLRLPFVSVDEIEKYLSDPGSLKAAAEADVSGLDDDIKVPIDLRLARGYRTPLQMAAEIGHQGIVKRLLGEGADINGAASEDDGRTALQAAAGGGHKEVVQILLAAKADINVEEGGRTALQEAAGGGHKEVVQILVDAGANINAPLASKGWTALQAAAKDGHTEIAKLLLGLKADVNSPAAEVGQTALWLAANGGHTEVVALLLDAKADLNASEEETALEAAARGGYKEIVKLLLGAGADANTRPTKRLLNPLQAAADGGHEEVVQILLHAGANVNAKTVFRGQTALEAAAGGGHMGLVKTLLAAKADVNILSLVAGRSALKAAAGGGYKEIVQILLDAGADVDLETAQNVSTALGAAAWGGHKEVVEMLLAANANVNFPVSTIKNTTIEVAAKAGHKELVELILATNADLNECGRGTALQAAAAGGHKEVVELLVKANADLNGSGKETALQAAAAGGYEEVVELLVKARADVNLVTEGEPRNALQLAANGGHKGVVKLLLDARADLNAASGDKENSKTPLQAAAEGGHNEVVELLLAVGANVKAELKGRRSLEVAAAGGHEDVVELLLKAKADIDALSNHNGLERTALQAAAGNGHKKLVELLLQAKANVNAAAGLEGRTALQAAAEGGHTEIVETLLIAGADINGEPNVCCGRTALQAAAGSGHREVVEQLLAAQCNVDAPPAATIGRTALQAAAESGHKGIVELLLAAKADVNVPGAGNRGRTAIQAAAGAGHKEVVNLLLAANADVNAPPAYYLGRTALQAAADGGHKEVVELLLVFNADINGIPGDHTGRTALQAASEKGHKEVVEFLLAAKADVNAPAGRNWGRTAIQAAAGASHKEIIELLLSAKANVNARAGFQGGRTALQAASENGHKIIVEFLLAAQANVNARRAREFGRTALRAAAGEGHVEIVELLLAAGAHVHTSAARAALQAARDKRHYNVARLLEKAIDEALTNPPAENEDDWVDDGKGWRTKGQKPKTKIKTDTKTTAKPKSKPKLESKSGTNLEPTSSKKTSWRRSTMQKRKVVVLKPQRMKAEAKITAKT